MVAASKGKVANAAIRAAVKKMRPSLDDSWMILVPDESPMSMPDLQQWTDFLGRVLAGYNDAMTPCSGPTVEELVGLQSKQLIVLRDKILEGTTCP